MKLQNKKKKVETREDMLFLLRDYFTLNRTSLFVGKILHGPRIGFLKGLHIISIPITIITLSQSRNKYDLKQIS